MNDYTSPDFWAKAPEGATHYLPAYGVINACWYILNEDHMAVMLADRKDEWSWRNIDSHDRKILIPRAIPRPASPAPWNGTGLPPAGTVCEIELSEVARKAAVDLARYTEHDRKVVRILDHHDIGGAVAALYAVKIGDHFEYHSLIAGNFRPIRTPEQIAAEERKRAIDAMQRIVSSGDPHYGRKVCEALYDAGYRKIAQETAK